MKNKPMSEVNLSSPHFKRVNNIMRITTILLSFCVMYAYADGASTQHARINLNKTNVILEEVLNDIEAQTDYLFVYNNEVEVNQKVSVNAHNKQVSSLLNEILKNSGIAYRMEGSHIILYKTNNPVLTQQRNTIKGRVVDESGEPIIGANVYEKNTIKGSITDIDGNFSLDVAPNATLVVSYIGYISLEVNVRNNREIEIVLQEDTQKLEEVVVVGYGTQKKANLTGAVATVSSEVLEDRPLTSVGAGLQGVIPGLYVSFGSGSPGEAAKFNIRGVSNLEGQASALVLIDGVEMDPTILNPNDIKEVTVLKDAASAAIYGSRAAYGVILITTKTGFITRKPQVTLTANYAINAPTVKPKGMNSLEYTQWMNDANMTTNGSPYFDDETMTHVRNYYNDPVNNLPVFNHSQDAASTWRYCGNTDWYETLNKNSYPMQQYNVSVVGGSETAMYYASAGYFNQKGISKWAEEDYDRYNIMQNVRYKVSNLIQVGLHTTLSISDRVTGGQNKHGGMALSNILAGDSRPLMPLYHPDGNFSGNSGDGSFTNPAAWQSLGGSANYRTHDAMARGTLKLTPIAGLSIDMDYTYRYYNWGFKNYRREYYDYDAAGVGALFPHTTPNAVSHQKREIQNNVLNIFATYEKKLKDIHSFKLMVGFNQESYLLKEVGLSRTNLMSNDIPFLNLATGDRATSDAQEEWTTRGTFFRFNYDLMDRYLFVVAGRYDASSRYPKDQRFSYFPSFSAAWKMSDENFWKPIKYYVNTFKVRASYGSLGDQGVYGSYPTISSYGTEEINYLFNGSKEMGVIAPALVSPQLTWEKVTDWNVGVDFGLLDNRLTGSVEVFQKDIKDLMTKSQQLPGILGANEPRTNAANLRFRGWEVQLNWKHLLPSGFNYQFMTALSDQIGWVTKYDNPTKSLSENFYEGMRIGEIWGFETEGYFKTDEEAAAWDQSSVVGYSAKAGDIKFADQNGDDKITIGSNTVDNPGDKKIIGNSLSRYYFTLMGQAEWRGVDLSLFFQGVLKRNVVADNTFYLGHYGSEWAVPQRMNFDYWRDDNPDAFFPRARFDGGSAVHQKQTQFLQNAAYIRLKQLQLGYTIPYKYVTKAKITKARIYFNAENLWEHSKMLDGFDPEIAQVNLYPLMRSYSFGINVTF